MLVQFTKPWNLFSVSALNTGDQNEKHSKFAFFFETSLQKNHEVDFFKLNFGENIVRDLAQLLAKTWYPYLFSVLRNLSHKFEKWAHVRNLRKIPNHKSISQNSKPKKTRSFLIKTWMRLYVQGQLNKLKKSMLRA